MKLTFGEILDALERWRISGVERVKVEQALSKEGIGVTPGLLGRRRSHPIRLASVTPSSARASDKAPPPSPPSLGPVLIGREG